MADRIARMIAVPIARPSRLALFVWELPLCVVPELLVGETLEPELELVDDPPVLVASNRGLGQFGTTSCCPKLLATHSTTPLVHPKPAYYIINTLYDSSGCR